MRSHAAEINADPLCRPLETPKVEKPDRALAAARERDLLLMPPADLMELKSAHCQQPGEHIERYEHIEPSKPCAHTERSEQLELLKHTELLKPPKRLTLFKLADRIVKEE